jgi:hypothetical protein
MNHAPAGPHPALGTVNCSPLVAAASLTQSKAASASVTQSKVDLQISQLSDPWVGSLPFQVRIIYDEHKDDVAGVEPTIVDITKYFNGGKYPCLKLYFSTELYEPPLGPPSTTDLTGVASWVTLRQDLCIAAHKSGSPIFSNGKSGCQGGRVFRCLFHRRDDSQCYSTPSTTEYRSTSMVKNDKGNRRPNGRTLPRRTKGIQLQHKCPFQFNVSWDQHGYFVVLRNRSGQPIHKHHPKIFDTQNIPMTTKLLTKQQVESLSDMVDSTATKASARNYIFKKFDKFLSSLQVSFVLRDKSAEEPNIGTATDISRMLTNFENSNEIKYTVLSDIPISDLRNTSASNACDDPGVSTQEGTITISTTQDESGNVVNTPITDLPMMSDIQGVAHSTRRTRQLASSVYLFIAIAWISLPAFRFFMLCPEVIWFDVTSHSNNKGFCLLTFSCRTSIDKQVVFMWVWIPNEQRYSFRWVFQVAIPFLIPLFLRHRVKFVMKDGDPQARNELLISLVRLLPNAIEGGCGWHILNQGMKTNVPGVRSVTKSNQKKWKSALYKIKQWIYSWMRPGYVEEEDEYKISKFLLLQFVCSGSVLLAADNNMHIILSMLRFLQGHVFIHEDLYLHFRRRTIRHFDCAHGSPHEVHVIVYQ